MAVAAAAQVQPRNAELMHEATWLWTVNAHHDEIKTLQLLGGSQIFNDGLDTQG